MAEQVERFLHNGEFVKDGPCGSFFCIPRCRDTKPSRYLVDPLTIWREAYEKYPEDVAGSVARQALKNALHEADTAEPFHEHVMEEITSPPTRSEVYASRAVTKPQRDVPTGGYL